MQISPDDQPIRIDSLIRQRGGASRKEVRSLVSEGRVALNGSPVTDPSFRCSTEDIITIDGKELPPCAPVAIMLNKPSGYVSVKKDPLYPSVMSLIKEDNVSSLFPIGRLDADTEGLLILTNSGVLSDMVARPEQELPKTYLAGLDRPLPDNAESILSAGVVFENGTHCKPARLERITEKTVYLTVTEGKYHEVKRLIRHCGPYVFTLKRVSIGGLHLDETLAPGEYRFLTQEEIDSIFSCP